MSRRMRDSDHVYRVVNLAIGIEESIEGRKSLTIAGPYAGLPTARAEATRQRARAKSDPYHSYEITVERATGWETV